jgi:hypothetical protein
VNRLARHTVFFLAVALVLFASADAFTQSAARVDRARYSVQGATTRVVLDVSKLCDYKISNHKNPDRIAINLPGSRAGNALKSLSLEDGVVDRVRVNRLSWGVQVVLDLQKPAAWKDFQPGQK